MRATKKFNEVAVLYIHYTVLLISVPSIKKSFFMIYAGFSTTEILFQNASQVIGYLLLHHLLNYCIYFCRIIIRKKMKDFFERYRL